MNFTNKLRLLFFVIIMLGFAYSGTAQATHKIEGDKVVKIKTTKTKAIDTGLTYTVKGKDYKVWKSPKGKYYIIRTSKNTGKEYRQYLKIEPPKKN